MRRKGFLVSRAVGGVAAGVLMAGAGVGVAVAGASSTSDQYTPGAKPYNGIRPHNVTVGTQTFPSSVTTTISNTSTTVTQFVTTPYSVSASTAKSLITLLEDAVGALNAQKAASATLATQLSAVLKGDLSNLLAPTGNSLKIAKLAKDKSVSLKFTSPGSGKLAVKWVLSVPGKKKVSYINHSSGLSKIGLITVKLPTTSGGRKALTRAKRANVFATVIYTGTSGNSIKVSRSYKLKG